MVVFSILILLNFIIGNETNVSGISEQSKFYILANILIEMSVVICDGNQ